MRALWLAAVVAATAAASGCAGPKLEREDVLKGACQFRPCVCADADAPFWRVPDTAEIIWTEDGTPSCPAGFVLERKDEG
jgi:hypothetical protein